MPGHPPLVIHTTVVVVVVVLMPTTNWLCASATDSDADLIMILSLVTVIACDYYD